MKKPTYKLSEKVWIYPGESANWHFVGVSKSVSKEIKETVGKSVRGFGSIPVEVTIGKTVWQTSIFPEKASGGYLLPLKADVRRKEGIIAGQTIEYTIKIR